MNGQKALSRDAALYEQKRDKVVAEKQAAEATRIELKAMQKKLNEDRRRMESMAEELSKIGALVSEKGADVDFKLAELEELKIQADRVKSEALAHKNRVEAEKEQIKAQTARAEEDRLKIIRQRLAFLHEKSPSRYAVPVNDESMISSLPLCENMHRPNENKKQNGVQHINAANLKNENRIRIISTEQTFPRGALVSIKNRMKQLSKGTDVASLSSYLAKEESFMESVRN